MKNIKYMFAIVTMISLGASAFTSLAGWGNTVFQYNAYFQGFVALCIFIWLCHKAISATEVRVKHPVTNARDNKKG